MKAAFDGSTAQIGTEEEGQEVFHGSGEQLHSCSTLSREGEGASGVVRISGSQDSLKGAVVGASSVAAESIQRLRLRCRACWEARRAWRCLQRP